MACLTGKLELLSEKTNAHRSSVSSVAFSPNGTKIVSGSYDPASVTIKVWESGAPLCVPRAPLHVQYRCVLACLAGKLELLSEKTIAHSCVITSVAFSPDGTKIVSGSLDKTIIVWDTGIAASFQNRPSSSKTDDCWLVSQAC